MSDIPADPDRARPDAITLAPVDEDLLARLTDVAIRDAAAPEVTPPLTDGDSWTSERVAWFEAYHRSSRAGLSSGHGEETWAIMRSGRPVGSVRLKRTQTPGVLETGLWVARSARGTGAAAGAMRALIDEARRAGAVSLRVDTTAANAPAMRLLSRLGFVLTEASPDGGVHGELHIG